MNEREIRRATPAAIDTRWVEVNREQDELRAKLALLQKQEDALLSEYKLRAGWARAFLVSGGHLHSSTSCSTCFPTTQFYWLTELSGLTEEEIVAKAGDRACTVCYPTAPVEVLRRKSVLFTPDEEAAEAARIEREEKRAAAKAASITVNLISAASSYLKPTGPTMPKVFKSERAVSNLLASTLKNLFFYTDTTYRPAQSERYPCTHPDAPEWEHDADALAAALAEVRGESAEDILATARAKAEKSVAAEIRKYSR